MALYIKVVAMKTKIKSTALLFLTAIIWGLTLVAQRVGADYVGPFTFNGIRFLLGTVSLIPVVLIFEREIFNKEKFTKTLFVGFIAGILLFIAASLQQFGVEITGSAGKAGFLTGLYTVLVPIMRFMTGKRTSILSFIGAALALCGLFLLCMTGNRLALDIGEITLIIGAAFWAIHILAVDKFVNSVSPLKFSMTQFFVCGLLSIVFALFTEDIQLSAIKSAGIPILYGGLLSVGVAYTCQILGQKNTDPTFAAIIFSTESVFGAICSAIILHEIMSGRGYLGCVLIFIGIVLSQLDLKTIQNKFANKK